LLKTPTDPHVTLMDDPLRILRALRFAITKGFLIDEDIWEAMKNPKILMKLKTSVSQERIREEVFKMMQKDTPSAIKILHEVDTHHIPGFLNLVFSGGLWLKPTFEKIKSS
jgi:tRNA nucleotidyltransferase/poly(A) polymerase